MTINLELLHEFRNSKIEIDWNPPFKLILKIVYNWNYVVPFVGLDIYLFIGSTNILPKLFHSDSRGPSLCK